MAAWGAVGRRRRRARARRRAASSAACRWPPPAAPPACVYGAIIELLDWVTFSGDHTLGQYLGARPRTSLPFNVAHAVGNVVFCLAFGPALVRALRRFRARLRGDAGAPGAGGRRAALVALALRRPGARAGRAARGERRLARRCLPRAGPERRRRLRRGPGQALDAALHGLGGASAWPPRAATRATSRAAGARRAPTSRAHRGRVRGDRGERRAHDPRPARRRRARARRRPRPRRASCGAAPRDGSFAGLVNTTAFGVLAAAGGRRGPRSGRGAPRRGAGSRAPATADGGFNFAGRGGPRRRRRHRRRAPGAGRGAAAAHARRACARAARFLAARQNADGGFALRPGGRSNAQSTAWAVQGLLAAGRDPAACTARRLARRRWPTCARCSGRRARSATRARARQTPVWVTAQALAALAAARPRCRSAGR